MCVIIALMLNIDRVFAYTRTFDGNAVLCTILAGWFVNLLRVGAEAPKFLNPLVTTVWCFGALCMLMEPARHKLQSNSVRGGKLFRLGQNNSVRGGTIILSEAEQ